ncbi:Hypothetical predicted protein [Cloeon dipterum]|uniref:Uncharacterized protein n=1 Tax=Cloeon dipterum TaxID=197152 RepID=A0A8S1DIE6_9INSE|nr:Hypothetical predicted protein [Cloeon dipterum]
MVEREVRVTYIPPPGYARREHKVFKAPLRKAESIFQVNFYSSQAQVGWYARTVGKRRRSPECSRHVPPFVLLVAYSRAAR